MICEVANLAPASLAALQRRNHYPGSSASGEHAHLFPTSSLMHNSLVVWYLETLWNRTYKYYAKDAPQVGSPSYESGKRSWSHSIWSFPTNFCVWGKSSWYPGGHLHIGGSWNEQWVKDVQVNRKVFNECRKAEVRWDNIIFWWKYTNYAQEIFQLSTNYDHPSVPCLMQSREK